MSAPEVSNSFASFTAHVRTWPPAQAAGYTGRNLVEFDRGRETKPRGLESLCSILGVICVCPPNELWVALLSHHPSVAELKLLTHGLDTDPNLSKAWLSLVPGNSGQEHQT